MKNFRPSADFVNITIPEDKIESLRERLTEPLRLSGGSGWGDGSCKMPFGGHASLRKMYRVGRLQLTGGALQALRDAGQFEAVLGVLAEFHHKVTTLHVALDLEVPAAPGVARVYKAGKQYGYNFGGWSVKPLGITRYSRGMLYAPSGTSGTKQSKTTGTVYCGKRGNGVMLRVYDKRNERIDRGFEDPGDWLRLEFQFGRAVGCSLRDVHDPWSIFYHHAQGLRGAFGVSSRGSDWGPGGQGFVVGAGTAAEPWERYKRLRDEDPGFRAFFRLVESIEPSMRDYVLRDLLKRLPT